MDLMEKAAKEKSFVLWIVASVALFCAPSFASSVHDLPSENRVEFFLLEGQNGTGQQAFDTANRVENYDSAWGVVSESLVAPNSAANVVESSIPLPQRAYQSGTRMADSQLLRVNTNTKATQNITEWRRTVSRGGIGYERTKFLGTDSVKIDAGTWRSLDGTRQFRTVPNDYLGRHGIGQPSVPDTPHVHFEFLAPPNPGGTNLRVLKNVHVPLSN
jgi:hypothetical protein